MNDHPTPPQPREPVPVHVVGQFSWGLTILFVLASVCWVLLPYTGSMFSALVFLLAIVLAGTRWNRGPVLAMGVVSALVWNFIFIPPRFTLHIEKPEDVIMFGMFFVVALSMGHLITQLREREAADPDGYLELRPDTWETFYFGAKVSVLDLVDRDFRAGLAAQKAASDASR